MSIQYVTNDHIAYSDDLLVTESEIITVEDQACYVSMWYKDIRTQHTSLTLMLAQDVHVDAAIGYARWMRSVGWCVSVVQAPVQRFDRGYTNWNGIQVRPDSFHQYGTRLHLRLHWTPDSDAFSTFIALNFMRFLTSDAGCTQQWLNTIFHTQRWYLDRVYGHFPLGYPPGFNNTKFAALRRRAKAALGKCSLTSAVFVFFYNRMIEQHKHAPRKRMGDAMVERTAGISQEEFMEFIIKHGSRLSEYVTITADSIITLPIVEAATESVVTQPQETQDRGASHYARVRPRDSRGRYISRKAAEDADTRGVRGVAVASILRNAGD